jgi:hypothetical protein
VILANSNILDRASRYDEHGFRLPAPNPAEGFVRTAFPSEVQRPPVRCLTAGEQELLCQWLAERELPLRKSFTKRTSNRRRDVEDTCLAEGLFRLIDRVCSQGQEWSAEQFDRGAWLPTIGGMFAAWTAMRTMALNAFTGGAIRSRPFAPQADFDKGEDSTPISRADEAESLRLHRVRVEAGRGIPESAGLAAVLATLDPIKLHIVSRYYGEDAEINDIAEELGLTHRQVCKRIERVFPTLQKRLAAIEPGVIHGR